MSSSKAVDIKGLTKTYKNNRGIRDINLEIETGDIFALLGPNGAGKTTAMKIMTGMMHPDAGDVRIFGHSILTEYEQAMASVGCIIETAASYPYLTAVENLTLTARSFGMKDKNAVRERIDEVLQMTGLGKFKHEKAANYSLGMKQRLGLAAAILPRPRLLILDEPLNGLDVEGMVEVRKLIKRLAATDQTTFFISSHLIHDVELTCDRIGVLFNGQLLRVDSKEAILRDHASLESYFMSEVDRYGKL